METKWINPFIVAAKHENFRKASKAETSEANKCIDFLKAEMIKI